jgi:hypothetical protein
MVSIALKRKAYYARNRLVMTRRVPTGAITQIIIEARGDRTGEAENRKSLVAGWSQFLDNVS